MGATLSATELIEKLEGELQPAALEVLQSCRRTCAERGLALYLVGGGVRDLLVSRSQIDLDLAIEGEVAPLALALAGATGGKAVLHPRFGTARVSGTGLHLDLAQTRRETYAHPGALPAVEPTESILDDLARRDFTINALALRLTSPVELIDPFGGAADLGAGLVRVLHEGSFRDDATRMLRAARYAARLGFQIEPLTELRLQRDLEFLDAISGPRLRRELTLIFEESRAVDATLLVARRGVLASIHPRLRLEAEAAAVWRQALAGPHYAPRDELGFCLVVNSTAEQDLESVSRRLHLTGRVETALHDLVRLRRLSAKLASAVNDPVAAVELLDGRAKAAVWALSLLDGERGRACASYLHDWQRVKPALTGNDLIAQGVPPGQQLGAILKRLRLARLSGEVWSREAELRLVRTELRKAAD